MSLLRKVQITVYAITIGVLIWVIPQPDPSKKESVQLTAKTPEQLCGSCRYQYKGKSNGR